MMFEHDYEAFPELSNSQLEQLQFSSPHTQITEDFDALVVKVYDGDTVTLETDFRDFAFKLRFLEIDSEEMNEGGIAARDWLRTKILGKKVHILMNPINRVGKYGRLLGRVLYNGMDVGEEEIQLGLCKAFGKKKEGEVPNAEKIFSMKQWF